MKFKDDFIWIVCVYESYRTKDGSDLSEEYIAEHDQFINTSKIIKFEPTYKFEKYGEEYKYSVKITVENGDSPSIIYSMGGLYDFIDTYMDENSDYIMLNDNDDEKEKNNLGPMSFS